MTIARFARRFIAIGTIFFIHACHETNGGDKRQPDEPSFNMTLASEINDPNLSELSKEQVKTELDSINVFFANTHNSLEQTGADHTSNPLSMMKGSTGLRNNPFADIPASCKAFEQSAVTAIDDHMEINFTFDLQKDCPEIDSDDMEKLSYKLKYYSEIGCAGSDLSAVNGMRAKMLFSENGFIEISRLCKDRSHLTSRHEFNFSISSKSSGSKENGDFYFELDTHLVMHGDGGGLCRYSMDQDGQINISHCEYGTLERHFWGSDEDRHASTELGGPMVVLYRIKHEDLNFNAFDRNYPTGNQFSVSINGWSGTVEGRGAIDTPIATMENDHQSFTYTLKSLDHSDLN